MTVRLPHIRRRHRRAADPPSPARAVRRDAVQVGAVVAGHGVDDRVVVAPDGLVVDASWIRRPSVDLSGMGSGIQQLPVKHVRLSTEGADQRYGDALRQRVMAGKIGVALTSRGNGQRAIQPPGAVRLRGLGQWFERESGVP